MHLKLGESPLWKIIHYIFARNVSPRVIRLLIDSYVRQQVCISWNGLNAIASYYKME